MGHSSFAYCRRVTRSAGSSFPLAFRLLPAAKRRAMNALYAFMRVTDDLADEPSDSVAQAFLPVPNSGTGIPACATKKQRLAAWRADLTAALAGRYSHPVHPALHDTLRRYGIPPRYLFDVIDGVEADLEPVRFATFAGLYPYCYRVASAVGLACVRVWELRPGVAWETAEVPAEAAGIAFQLTNILRDLGEDLARGRVYLPADELDRFDCPPERWRDPRAADAFRRLLAFQVARARAFYRRAEPLGRLLTPDGRAIFRVMAGTYRALLDAVAAAGPDLLARRVAVGRWRKLGIFLSAWPVKWGWL